MSNVNSVVPELNAEALDQVAGGMPFYGMNCSVNQDYAIQGIVEGLGKIPIVGGVLAGIAGAIGQIICS